MHFCWVNVLISFLKILLTLNLTPSSYWCRHNSTLLPNTPCDTTSPECEHSMRFFFFFWAMAFSTKYTVCLHVEDMLLCENEVLTGRICRYLCYEYIMRGVNLVQSQKGNSLSLSLFSSLFLSLFVSVSPAVERKFCWLQTFPSEKNGDLKTIAQNTICICAPEPVGFSVRLRNSSNPTLFKLQP